MTRVGFDVARAQLLANTKTKKGLEMFEKYIGRINWMHPEEQKYVVRENKKYRVINKSGETIFEANRISDIAKEFCLSVSRVANSVNSLTLLKGEYLVERCGDE